MPKGDRQAQTVANDGQHANRRRGKGRRQHDAGNDSHNRGGRGRQPRGRAPGRPADDGSWSLADIQAVYAACVRCGYFLSGYRLSAPTETLDQAIASIRGSWLELPWTPAMRELLEKSYGIRLDSDVYQFKGRCSECARVFVLWDRELAEDEAEVERELGSAAETGTETEMATETEAEVDLEAAVTESVVDADGDFADFAAADEDNAPAVVLESDINLTFRIQIRPRPR